MAIVMLRGSKSSVPACPNGARAFTRPKNPRFSWPETSRLPPLPPCAPPFARMVPPNIVFLSDQITTFPALECPTPDVSITLSRVATVLSVDEMSTRPPCAASAPLARMLPATPTLSPMIVTCPWAAPGSAAETSIVPVLSTVPSAFWTFLRLACQPTVPVFATGSAPSSRTTPPCSTKLLARMTPL